MTDWVWEEDGEQALTDWRSERVEEFYQIGHKQSKWKIYNNSDSQLNPFTKYLTLCVMSEQIPLPRFSVSVSDFVVSIIGLLQSGVSFDIIFLGLGG